MSNKRNHDIITVHSTKASSQYNGVSKTKSKKHGGKGYEARFSKYRVGSYILEVDAALAYDGLVRASGWKDHYLKINFAAEQDYIDAREKELEARALDVELEETLAYITAKVGYAASKIRSTRV